MEETFVIVHAMLDLTQKRPSATECLCSEIRLDTSLLGPAAAGQLRVEGALSRPSVSSFICTWL